MSHQKIPPGRVTPWHQTSWDWRAAGNFIGGGSGTGLLFFATLAAGSVDNYRIMVLVALAFIGGGATSQTVAVSTIEDTILEGTEDFAVTIDGESVGNVTTSQVDTDILDNDASNLNWSISGTSEVTEGGSGVYTVSYTGVTLAPGQTATITVGSTNSSSRPAA